MLSVEEEFGGFGVDVVVGNWLEATYNGTINPLGGKFQSGPNTRAILWSTLLIRQR